MKLSITFSGISLSMPYVFEGTYIPDWAKSPEANQEFLNKIFKHSKVYSRYELDSDLGVDVYVHKLRPDVDFYFMVDEGIIQYGVEVKHYKLIGNLSYFVDPDGHVPDTIHAVGQVSVWRNTGCTLTSGFPKYFFKKLHEKYGRILSDYSQSTNGKAFWANRIREVREQRGMVWVVDCEKHGQELKVEEISQLQSMRDFDKYYSQGQDLSGSYFRFML